MGNHVNNLQIEQAEWQDDIWANPPDAFDILPTTDINSEWVTFLSCTLSHNSYFKPDHIGLWGSGNVSKVVFYVEWEEPW